MTTRIDPDTYRSRVTRLRSRIAEVGCDSAFLTNLASIRYLTGFTGTAGFFAVTPTREHIIVDFRYVEQAGEQCPCPMTKREGSFERALPGWLDSARACVLESQNVTLATKKKLDQATTQNPTPSKPSPTAAKPSPTPPKPSPTPPKPSPTPPKPSSKFEWKPILDLVEKVRAVKDESEIRRLAASAALLEELMVRTLETIRPGVEELEVALAFETAARKATGRLLPFEPIIASGHRSALPHGVASKKLIATGDFVVVDIGLDLDGYVADMTRTVAVGRADDRMRDVHEAVHLANRTAAKGIRPGMSGEDAHMLAAAVLESRELAQYFGHGLGHGIGVEIHEDPRLAPQASETLEVGMVFTIEPGAYIPGWGGVRIEDAGVLRTDGVEIFNKLDRGLLIV